ncbi:MAG: hypothetical protein IJS94_01460 [Clostridia bacterium]|nr:hypothetical protein [Clostridia bacterium]
MKTPEEKSESPNTQEEDHKSEKKNTKNRASIWLTVFGCIFIIAMSVISVMKFEKDEEFDNKDGPGTSTLADSSASVTEIHGIGTEFISQPTSEKSDDIFWGHSEGSDDPEISSDGSDAALYVNGLYNEGKRSEKVNPRVTFIKNLRLEGRNEDEFPLYDRFMEADDDDLFALDAVLTFDTGEYSSALRDEIEAIEECAKEYSKPYEEMTAKCSERLYEVINRLQEETGMSRESAELQAQYDPAYKEAKDKLRECCVSWISALLKRKAELKKAGIEFLFGHCTDVKVRYDTETESEIIYLGSSKYAIVVMSKAQIMELGSGEYDYTFTLSDDRYSRYRLSSYYYAPEGEFPDDKMTNAARDAFRKANGEPIEVIVRVTLPEREKDEFDLMYQDETEARWARALAKAGLTQEDYDNLDDKDSETVWIVRKVTGYFNSYPIRAKERQDLLDRLFEDGEIISDQANVLVLINYERALELSKDWNVVLIRLKGADERTYNYDPDDPNGSTPFFMNG